ncbi:FAD-dependent monooxygenase [Aggregicoccus sp. 17bor-14]|uniref:FAD-dependent oxidoreductase n=1 Tax=Myxococcaceae TaxID=31 RepID=UPI00129C8D48|nr:MULTISPECIES: NAD(P)/FAD-dependent oxidoreductase [Myxococcaceae]MBF5046655.1 FAD-dependent monooxygenase [Simulacricoccus sp. 17bor-14]MRI92364.1 FAD-dependent monooxygenase [Aggregicoccus sp. 17bor-14]
MKTEKHVGIVGGGPGGLTLARILATRGIASTVLELDAHPLARPQGGSLDIHAESGQRALRLAGLEAQFRALARYDDQALRIYDAQGTLHYEEADPPQGDRPEIDRTQLRSLLLQSLPEGTVRRGSHVRGVQPLEDGRYQVLGADGALGTFDLVVGADGAWSRVRPLLSDARPRYTGVTFVELEVDEVDARHPGLARLIPHGKIFALGGGKALIAQRNSQSRLRIYVALRVPEDWASGGLDLSTPGRTRAALKGVLAGWAPELLALVEQASDVIVVRRLVALPVGHRWAHRPGLTLLGDAAHVMSPFSGEGVNIAMLDAAELGLRLAAEADWSRAVQRYEQDLFPRAAAESARAAEALDTAVSEQGLQNMLSFFRALQGAAA